jgi:GNAT superfamily N-acetyltransferase
LADITSEPAVRAAHQDGGHEPGTGHAGATDPADLLTIRPLAEPDVTAVCGLWSGYVTEGFADNFAGSLADGGAAPDGGLEQHVSLDRWGPGVSMPMLPGALTPHMPKEPSYAVAEQVAAMVGNPRYRCHVAELTGVLVGFVSFSVRPLASGDEQVAAIEDLFVDPLARRAGIGTALVRSALALLRGERVGVFHALVPRNPRYAGARRLFSALGWEQDMIAFGLYD